MCRFSRLFPRGLPATELRGFSGVLNSTSNVVLTEVEKWRSFDEAVKRAQAMGIAETDPAQDLDGWDSAVKVAVITTVLMGVPTHIDQVQRTGIRDLTRREDSLGAGRGDALQACLPRGTAR